MNQVYTLLLGLMITFKSWGNSVVVIDDFSSPNSHGSKVVETRFR